MSLFTGKDLANIIWSLVHLKAAPSFAWLAAFCKQSVQQFDKSDSLTITTILFGLARLKQMRAKQQKSAVSNTANRMPRDVQQQPHQQQGQASGNAEQQHPVDDSPGSSRQQPGNSDVPQQQPQLGGNVSQQAEASATASPAPPPTPPRQPQQQPGVRRTAAMYAAEFCDAQSSLVNRVLQWSKPTLELLPANQLSDLVMSVAQLADDQHALVDGWLQAAIEVVEQKKQKLTNKQLILLQQSLAVLGSDHKLSTLECESSTN